MVICPNAEHPPHILHIFPTFVPGGQQVRVAAVISALGGAWRHTIVAMDGCYGAEQRIRGTVRAALLPPPAPKNPLSLRAFVRNIGPDLLATYNWGAIEATAAGCLLPALPVVHAEDGFGSDEATGPKLRRSLARRAVLNAIHMTVVPSRSLFEIARHSYGVSQRKLRLIVNGVDALHFQPRRDPAFRRSLAIADDELLFGFVGHLREEKNLPLLLRAFAAAGLAKCRLMLVGDGPCRPMLELLSRELGVAGKVIFCGHSEDTSRFYAIFDVFVMSSATEQMPMALLEAMACGLPAVCTDAGDTQAMLGESPVPLNDLDAYAKALRCLCASAELRISLGARNRRRATELYTFDRMVDEYAELYSAAARSGRET